MKKIFFVITFFICFSGLNAQTDTSKADEIFTIVEQMPSFPGGETALNEFFAKNLMYPVFAKEQGIQGKVWVQFIVGTDGTISSVEVIRPIGGGCDEEAVRVIKLMPKWNPGKQSGRAVIVKYNFPIKFTLR